MLTQNLDRISYAKDARKRGDKLIAMIYHVWLQFSTFITDIHGQRNGTQENTFIINYNFNTTDPHIGIFCFCQVMMEIALVKSMRSKSFPMEKFILSEGQMSTNSITMESSRDGLNLSLR